MPSRTVTVTGKIQNTGTIAPTFQAQLFFDPPGASMITEGSPQLALSPGVTSPLITLKVTGEVPYGTTIKPLVTLHRITPSPKMNIATAGPWSYTEPHIYGGELTDWGEGVAGIGGDGLSKSFSFVADDFQAVGSLGYPGEGTPWPWIILGGGLLWAWKSGSLKKLFRR